jgi:SRSO17 transposase
MSVKALALSLPAQAFQTISWREGTNAPLTGRFAAVRVRHAGGNAGKARLRPQEWLLIEWPVEQAEPVKYILSTLPERTPLNDLVSCAYQRWRIERGYQDLKQDFGLGHYEGRGWRGLHHHASLSIAADAFLIPETPSFLLPSWAFWAPCRALALFSGALMWVLSSICPAPSTSWTGQIA